MYLCIQAILNTGVSSSSFFLDTWSLFMSYFTCNALCIVIGFLVFSSIDLNFFQVHFKNGPKYLTKGTALPFIHFDEISAVVLCFQKRFWSSKSLVEVIIIIIIIILVSYSHKCLLDCYNKSLQVSRALLELSEWCRFFHLFLIIQVRSFYERFQMHQLQLLYYFLWDFHTSLI